jgi:hypothetical protein
MEPPGTEGGAGSAGAMQVKLEPEARGEQQVSTALPRPADLG